MQAVKKITIPEDTPDNVSERVDNTLTDRSTFSILVREHHRGLLVYARALTGESHTSRDLVQDAFVVAWRNLGAFDVTRDFASWMRGIVRNKWRESLRKSSRQVTLDETKLELLEADSKEWDCIRDQGGVFARLEECLKKLPDGLAEAVKVFYYDGCSGDEAAEALNVQSATVRKRLERARSGLRTCMQR